MLGLTEWQQQSHCWSSDYMAFMMESTDHNDEVTMSWNWLPSQCSHWYSLSNSRRDLSTYVSKSFAWPWRLSDVCILRSVVQCYDRRLLAFQRFKLNVIYQPTAFMKHLSSHLRHGPVWFQYRSIPNLNEKIAQIEFGLSRNGFLPPELFGAWQLACVFNNAHHHD